MAFFYVTFGQKYRNEPHPIYKGRHRIHPDGYWKVEAKNYEAAREIVSRVIGMYFAFMYDNEPSNLYYPLGQIGEIKENESGSN